jgi:hypothetical protein
MARKTSEELKSVFQNGDLPNEENFSDLIDSCYNTTSGANLRITFVDNNSVTNSVVVSGGLIFSWDQY